MEKKFEAYYSKGSAWIFFALTVAFLIGIVLFGVFWIPELSLMFIVVLSVCCAIFLSVFIVTLSKDGVAVSIENGALVLHKRKKVTIPLKDVIKITMTVAISFDISVKHANGRCSLHCFIKDQKTKKLEFENLLAQKGIHVESVNISCDG